MARLLAYGVLRELSLLQGLTAQMMDKPLAVDDEIHALLLIGLYQLRNLETPPHAAINETVAAAEVMKRPQAQGRSEEHTSELQSLMRISYAVFCLKKKNTQPPLTISL